jgi:hypothetical protein
MKPTPLFLPKIPGVALDGSIPSGESVGLQPLIDLGRFQRGVFLVPLPDQPLKGLEDRLPEGFFQRLRMEEP